MTTDLNLIKAITLVAVGFVIALILVGLYARSLIRKMQAKPERPTTETPVEDEEVDDEPRAIDPNNPPTYQIYRPRSGDSTLKCTCHGESVRVGEKVLLWPIPGHPEGAVDIFCHRTYEVAQ